MVGRPIILVWCVGAFEVWKALGAPRTDIFGTTDFVKSQNILLTFRKIQIIMEKKNKCSVIAEGALCNE